MRHSVTDPAVVALLVAHVLSAVVGYGALAITGGYARLLQHLPDPCGSHGAVREFFRPGANLAARAIILVPIFGAALVVAEGGSVASATFVWIGVAIWLASLALCAYVIWPAERTVQALLARAAEDRAALLVASRRLERGAALVALCFLAALVVMVAQPS